MLLKCRAITGDPVDLLEIGNWGSSFNNTKMYSEQKKEAFISNEIIQKQKIKAGSNLPAFG
ncbi:MAG: hypothetical protein ACOCXH_15700 [Cyclobacteriaceae bacterium]